VEVRRANPSPSRRVPLIALTKAEAAYVEVRAQIIEGTLAPGSTIHQESLANALGLSVTPLREALRRLEGEGLIALRPHHVVSVLPLTRRELGELCVARVRLEPLAASLAAESATPRELSEISALARQSQARDLHAQLRAHREFHHSIYAASHNAVLADLLEHLWTRTDRYRAIVLRDRVLAGRAVSATVGSLPRWQRATVVPQPSSRSDTWRKRSNWPMTWPGWSRVPTPNGKARREAHLLVLVIPTAH